MSLKFNCENNLVSEKHFHNDIIHMLKILKQFGD